MADSTPKKQKCPKCKKYGGLELIYGALTEKYVDRVKQGLAIPGGFMPKKGPVYKWNCGTVAMYGGKFKLDNNHCMISVLRPDFV